VARGILPWAQTPMNVMGYGAERTIGLNFLSAHYYQEVLAGGVRKDAAYARLALGTSILMTFGLLAMNGYLHGRGPKDPKLRKMYRDNGWAPYSIALPGMNPVSFLGYSPFSEIMGQAADFSELVNQGADDVTLGKIAGGAVLSTIHVMGEYPMLKGLAELAKAITEEDPKFLGQAFKSLIPLPGLQGIARTLSGFTDPYQRETDAPQGGNPYRGTSTAGALWREWDALWQEFAAATPWLQNYQHPMRDILGRPLMRQGGWWALFPSGPSPQQPHPVVDELIKHSIAIGLPVKAFGPGKQKTGVMDDVTMGKLAVPLSADEWARYQELAGTVTLKDGYPTPAERGGLTLEQELTRVIASPEYQAEADGPSGGKADMIKSTFREYREEAKEKLFVELRKDGKPGRLEQLVEERQLEEEFKGLTKAEQAKQRPALEQKLGRKVNIGIVK
jgi:hypothetical protein